MSVTDRRPAGWSANASRHRMKHADAFVTSDHSQSAPMIRIAFRGENETWKSHRARIRTAIGT